MKELYRISEVAKVTELSRSTIMRYEERGLLKPCYIDPSSKRRYYDIYNVL